MNRSKLVHSINVLVGGGCGHADVIADAEHHAYATALLTEGSAVLLGRNTFDIFNAFWPHAAARSDLPDLMRAFARRLASVTKFVATRRDVDLSWPGSERVGGELRDIVARLRERVAGPIVVFGSPGLGRALRRIDAVDELHVVLQPLSGPSEPKFSDDGDPVRRLRRIACTPFASGAVLLRYQRGDGHGQ